MINQTSKISHLNKFIGVTLGLILSSGLALADGLQPFNEKAFTDAQNADQTIVLDYHADWCPTCRRQKPALIEALKAKNLSKAIAFQVDFDEQPLILKKDYKVGHQSTIIVLKGKALKGQQTGTTDTQEIQHLVETGL